MAVWVEEIRRAAARFGKEKHMTKTKQREQQPSVRDAKSVLADLEVKREKHIARGRELPELRSGAAYLAHVEGSPGARRTLNEVSRELATYESELAAIDAAIGEARNRILIAQAFEADATDRARAARALEILGAFRETGRELDDALRGVCEKGKLLGGLLGQLHSCGVVNPTREQLDVLGYSAMQTALMSTPWANRFRFLGPSQRRSFGPLFDAWAQTAESRLKAQLRDHDEETEAVS
jgi:hypothetical protein